MATRDPFVHLERLYAEALLAHHGLISPEAAPAAAPLSRRRLLLRVLPYTLLVAALVAAAAGATTLATALLVALTGLAPLLLLVRAVGPLRRTLHLSRLTLRSAAIELAISGALLAGLTVAPGLLPPLGAFFTVRLLYGMRHRFRSIADASTIRLERARIARGVEPRIYGLVDERHGGDATRLAHHGEEIARLRASAEGASSR